MFLCSGGGFCVDRDTAGRFVKGHKQLARNQHIRIRGKLVSWNKFCKHIDSLLCRGSNGTL